MTASGAGRLCDEENVVRSAARGCIKKPSWAGKMEIPVKMREVMPLVLAEDSIIAEADTVGRRIWNQVLKAGPLTLPGRSR